MSAPPLPYFFDEAELASNARQPGDREKALSFTLDDLKLVEGCLSADPYSPYGRPIPSPCTSISCF